MNKLKEFLKKRKSIILFSLMGIGIVALPTISIIISEKEPKFAVYEEKLQLKYEGTRCQLVDATQTYIDSISPNSSLDAIVIVDKCLEYDIDICFVLAQGQLESNFGTAGLARKTNSVFNVYAYDGMKHHEIDSAGKYKHPDESVEPYIKLLKKRYLKNKTEYDLLDKYVDVDGNRYATATNYETSLTSLYINIKNTTEIDKLSLQLKKYSLLLNN